MLIDHIFTETRNLTISQRPLFIQWKGMTNEESRDYQIK
jgi:hypothetical protein